MDRIFTKRGLWAWIVKPLLLLQAACFFIPFSFRNHPPKRYALMKQFIAGLRADQSTQTQNQTRIGAVGFCWGAYGVTHMAQDTSAAQNGQPLIDVAYTAHPSEVKVEDFTALKVPYSMVVGDVDFAMKIEQVRDEEKLLAANTEVECEAVVIPGARHGFAVRGSPDDPVEKEMADQAEDQVVRWFARHL
ncbi:hypothetical protein DL95DRAFT_527681 [Leptodontidium sp. 2 PMI_412]|nr:hypothetical protein DL95DRAFT_527681 [Leptodontidium sp. 2 PMI_412]